ncbi:MAG TPA: hypothetical protein VHO72_00520 [Bacteroidales bacterium]|nr:hypothetical protein [Bacteroidales bacterium]
METTDNKYLQFIYRRKYYLGLILLILIILIWHYSKMHSLQKSTEKERLELVTKYETKLDSLNTVQLQQTAKAFSWAVRSELIRGNKDQINQFFNEFIRTPGIIKLQLINPESSIIEISTDKKDEGSQNADYNNIKNQEVIKEASELKIVTPISGMNKQIGVFILVANHAERRQ